jgi:chromosome segregation ATPase
MELLRNYQIRKQLGLIEASLPETGFDEASIQRRIHAAYQQVFSKTQNSSTTQVVSRAQSPSIKNSKGSPSASFHIGNVSTDSSEMRQIIVALESRVDELEQRNMRLSSEVRVREEEVIDLRRQIDQLRTENKRLLEQVKSLQLVVSSESCAEKVLERVNNHSEASKLEVKLEIYKQQIAILNREVAELKKVSHS